MAEDNTIKASKRDSAPVGKNDAATRQAVQDNWNKLWSERMQQNANGASRWVISTQVTVSDYDLAQKVKSEIDEVINRNGLSDNAVAMMRPIR